MRIAMVGLRGLPATFGGIERHVEEIGARLARRGHELVVFCRPQYTRPDETEYRGMRLVMVPTPSAIGAEAFVHSAMSAARTVGRGFDVVHFHALGPGLFTPLVKADRGVAVVQTIHGRDDARAKWGKMAGGLLRMGGHISAHVPDEVIVVSKDLQHHYRTRHGRETWYVPNGVPQPSHGRAELLRRWNLTAGRYVIFLGRLVPEKDPLNLIRAFRDVSTPMNLVIVGDSSHTDRYKAELQEAAAGDPRVIFTGYQYGEALATLLGNAALFVQPSLLEGLPITLLEAAAYEVPVVASDIPPHREVIRSPMSGQLIFRAGDQPSLTEALARSLADGPGLRVGAKLLHDDVVSRYDWDEATRLVEEVYERASHRAPAKSRVAPHQDQVPLPSSTTARMRTRPL